MDSPASRRGARFFPARYIGRHYGKGLAGGVLVVLFVNVEFVGLGIDESVHRVDDDPRNTFGFGFGQQPMKNGTDVGEGFARAGARSNDEVFARYAQADGFELMAVERVALEDIGHRVVEQAGLRNVFDAAGLLVGGIELKERIGPELAFRER